MRLVGLQGAGGCGQAHGHLVGQGVDAVAFGWWVPRGFFALAAIGKGKEINFGFGWDVFLSSFFCWCDREREGTQGRGLVK